MKLIFAIVSSEDDHVVMRHLNKERFSVTKMASTGGFLRTGNTTLLVGSSEENVDKIIEIITKYSKRRKQIMVNTEPYIGAIGFDNIHGGSEIEVGGATIFVVDVDRFEKA